MAVPVTVLATALLLVLPIFISAREAPAGLDPALQAAEKAPRIIKVRQDGSGEFKTVTDAVKSIPQNNKVRTIVWIGPGVYKEKIKIDMYTPFVTFYGTPGPHMPKITFDGTAAQYGTTDSGSLIVESDYFVMANIFVENSAPEPTGAKKLEQAVAMEISGNKAAFYNCRFSGFQDTLLDDAGSHYFHNCVIEGTVDFIFGKGKSLYEECTLRSLSKGGAMIASSRDKDDNTSGYSFVRCNITGSGNIILGRTWRDRAKVVIANSFMDEHVAPAGWETDGKTSTAHVFYGEYQNEGPGANTDKRVPYAKKLTEAEVKPYLDRSYINAATWLLPPPKL